MIKIDKGKLDRLYCKYNHRRFVHPDPLEFLYDYRDIRDREIVGLIASGLAYGRVKQILKSVSVVLERIKSPAEFLADISPCELERTFRDFKHRFTTGEDLARLLSGVKRVIKKYGSLHTCFMKGFSRSDQTICPAAVAFIKELTSGFNGRRNSLLPIPASKGASKRLNLFLRWMVRSDEVDPGGWDDIPTDRLIIPLDTHMHKIGLALGLTDRRSADLKTAMQITKAFRRILPDDPVKYDFALTRLGIRNEINLEDFLEAA